MSKPNIFFIVFDSLRQQTFQELLEAGELPTLEKITEKGRQFTNAASNAAWTLPAHSSMFTGKRVSRHKTHAGSKVLSASEKTLAGQLSADGYTTIGISGNTWVSPEFGFGQGFDRLSMKWDYCWNGIDLSTVSKAPDPASKLKILINKLEVSKAPQTLLNALYGKFIDGRHDMGGRNTTRRACKWIKTHANAEQPFFFFINYLEPHLEYEPPREYRERFLPGVPQTRIDRINQDPWAYISGESDLSDEEFEILEGLYKAETVYVDSLVGKLRTKLKETDQLENTCFVIVGDHGENIGDHQLMDHQYCLYETLLNVPLVVQYPDNQYSGEVVSAPVETRDLFPTILSMADIDVPSDPEISHNDLGQTPGREYVIGEYRFPQPAMDSIEAELGYLPERMHQYNRALRSIKSNDLKLIEDSEGMVELYDLGKDPEEDDDIAAEYPQRVQRLTGKLDEEGVPTAIYGGQQGDSDGSEMSEASKERLESLGYI